MTRTIVFLAALAVCALSDAYADFTVTEKGMWPNDWPEELEPLRDQSRTLVGPLVHEHYEIPFSSREDFEAAWPHLLTVKSQGAPIILVRGPDKWLGNTLGAGVRIHAPPAQADKRANPAEPLPGERPVKQRWMWTTYVELVVDGKIVDLNRIRLPADAPIVDERFEGDLD